MPTFSYWTKVQYTALPLFGREILFQPQSTSCGGQEGARPEAKILAWI